MIIAKEFKMTLRMITLLSIVCLSLSACSTNMSRTDRAVMGGVMGGAVGGAASQSVGGAAAGAGIGAILGAVTY